MRDLLADEDARIRCAAPRKGSGAGSSSANASKHNSDRFAARALEVVASSILLLLFSPAMLVIAILVKLDSRGPVFFVQERVGQFGQIFRMFKFRSMVVDAEQRQADLMGCNERSGPTFKMRRDPRITRVGAFLRRYSLDEVPQLLNVIQGNMSLIGPRPALPREVMQYSEVQRRRLDVKPGLTGLWQVSGRANLSFEQSIELDLYYVENRSLALDMRILMKTAAAVLSTDGAY